MELGDAVEVATTKLGVKSLVHRWFGENCGCDNRKEKLNQLSLWAKASARQTKEQALSTLGLIIGEDYEGSQSKKRRVRSRRRRDTTDCKPCGS